MTSVYAYSEEKVTFAVSNPKNNWTSGAEAALKKVKGVRAVKADAKAQTVKVTYDPKQASLGDLSNAIAPIGTPQLLLKVDGMH
ncbi:MAG: heavy-metal-associated domain-containing protein [Abditibacteriales bacterium]|nr:heavy-metal-associated domain-containing protein [Abditibacteriales bacterium]